MNPDLKDLRVAVVPSETGNDINQQSTYEEIVACEETTYFSVPDYFKAQNDEELPMHWSFLLDYNKKVDCTGMNTDGIDYNQRAIDIAEIKRIIAEHGETTSTDMELDTCPCLYSKGNDNHNISELVEDYRKDGVETITYVGEQTDGYSFYDYDDTDLSDEIIAEIRRVMEDYEADMLKTEKRCSD